MKKLLVLVIVVVLVAGAGYFYVSKTREKGGGEKNQEENGGENENIIIQASFTYTWDDTDGNGQVSVNEPVTFNGSASTPSNASFFWDFGDGFVDATDSSVVTHYFKKAGTFNVTLNVSYEGAWDNETKQVTVVEGGVPQMEIEIIKATDLTSQQRNITYRVNIVFYSGSQNQSALSNFALVFNRTNNETGENYTYYNVTVDSLPPPPVDVTKLPAGIYYVDTDASGTISLGDNFAISGDGGIGIQSGDVLAVLFIPSGDFIASDTFP